MASELGKILVNIKTHRSRYMGQMRRNATKKKSKEQNWNMTDYDAFFDAVCKLYAYLDEVDIELLLSIKVKS